MDVRRLRRRAAMNIETMASYICKPSLEVTSHPEVEIQLLKQVYYNHKVWKLSFYGSLCHGGKKQPSLAIVTSWASICFSRGAGNTTGCNCKLGEEGLEPCCCEFSLATALPQECNYGFTRARAQLHNRIILC